MKHPRLFKLVRLLLCLPLLFAPGAPAQQPVPVQDEPDEVIRLDTELVQVRAVVTDKTGQLVDGLKQEDFEVLEDGRPQEVKFFSVDRAPETTDAPVAVPSERPNRARPARTVVLFVDTLHLSPPNLTRAKRSMRKFVDEMMTSRDSVAVVSTDGSLGSLQQFTSDRAILRRAIDKLKPFLKPSTAFTPDIAAGVVARKDSALNRAIEILYDEEGYESVSMVPEMDISVATARARQILGEEERLRRLTLQTLAAVSDRLAAMRGQRLLAFVSNGFSSFDEGGTVNRLPLQQVTARAARSGVVIYTLYGLGLNQNSHRMNGTPSAAAESTLREMADATGGRAFLNTNDLGESMRQLIDANRVSYMLAYYPPKGGDPARMRKLSVRLKNRPGYSVRAQQGYLPPERLQMETAATPRERLYKEIVAPLPATALEVSAAAYFLEQEGDDAQVTLRVYVGGGRLAYAESGGENRVLRCEVEALFLDEAGQVAHTAAEVMTVTLTPAQLAEARSRGFRYTRRVKLKPGLYQARVGVREVGSELVGTTSAWVEVPDLSKSRVGLSGIFVKAAAGGGGGEQRDAPRLLLEGPVFKAGEELSYWLVVYDLARPKAQEGAEPQLKVEVLRGETEVFADEWHPLSARTIRRDAKGTETGGQLKLNLSPGLYTLRVTARETRSEKSVTQTTDFEVVP